MLAFQEIDHLYRSADIGFALYGDQDLNHKYAGLSSGKLFNFMRVGIPIITNSSPTCNRAICETGCGVCIDKPSEIGRAMHDIIEREGEFIESCLNNFEKFNFEINYRVALMENIEKYLCCRPNEGIGRRRLSQERCNGICYGN